MLLFKKAMRVYKAAGVNQIQEEKALESLLYWLRKTFPFSKLKVEDELKEGFFANVISLGNGLGIALCTDGVGTKILIAQMMDKYDTIGIDCVAMNVNDIICVGATPMTMLDYIAVEKPNNRLFDEIGKGLYQGAKQAGINFSGGEIAQVKDMIHSYKKGFGFDLVGMAVGTVPLNKIIVGQDIKEGDIIIGIRSSGIHSNGLSMARDVLFKKGRFKVNKYIADIGRTVGEELLEPTYIYVQEILDLLKSELNIKALINITSAGFLNLSRVTSKVGFVIQRLPEPHPIFNLIQRQGKVSDEEMFFVYNMGIGFCVIVPEDEVDSCIKKIKKHGKEAHRLGYVKRDPEKRVKIEPKRLIGKDITFRKY